MDRFLSFNLHSIWKDIFTYCGFQELVSLCHAHPAFRCYLQDWLLGPYCSRDQISYKFDLYNWTSNFPEPYKDNKVYTDDWDPTADLIDLKVEGGGGGNYVALFGSGPTTERQETILLLGQSQPTFTIQDLSKARLIVTSRFVVVVGTLGSNPAHCSVFDRKSHQCATLENVKEVFELDDQIIYRTAHEQGGYILNVLTQSEDSKKLEFDPKCGVCHQHLIMAMLSLSTGLKLCPKCKTLTMEDSLTRKCRVIPIHLNLAGDSLTFHLRTIQGTAFVTVTECPKIGSGHERVLGVSCISLNSCEIEMSRVFPEDSPVFDLQFAVSSSFLVLQHWNQRKNCLVAQSRVSGVYEELELPITCRAKSVEIVNDRVLIVIPEYSCDEEDQYIYIKDLLDRNKKHFEIPMDSGRHYVLENGRGYATAQWKDRNWILRTFLYPDWSDQKFEETFF